MDWQEQKKLPIKHDYYEINPSKFPPYVLKRITITRIDGVIISDRFTTDYLDTILKEEINNWRFWL